MNRWKFSGAVLAGALVLMGQGCVLGGNNTPSTSGPAGVFVSTNRGDDWQSVSYLPTVQGVQSLAGVSVFRLVDDPHDPNAVYWLSRGSGMFYSYDEGRSWQRSVPPLDSGFIYDLAVHPLNKCTLIATNGRQIFRSDDCSRSWKEIYREGRPQVTIRSLAYDPFGTHDIFALSDNGDLLHSFDEGLSWKTIVRFSTPSVKIVFDKNRENLAYVTTRTQGMYRTTDKGGSWESLKDELNRFPGGLEYRSFQVYPSEANHIYWISRFGVLVSKNAGDDWEPIDLITPPGSAAIYGFAVNPENENEVYYTGTVGVKSTFYRSLDGGTNWVTKRLPSDQIPTVLRPHPGNDEWLYMGFTVPAQ